MSPVRFGLLRYSTSINLGDEIQSLAARRWLPRVDMLVDREALDADPDPGGDKVAMFLNGWFMHRPERWPPHPRIEPLIVSLHLAAERPGGRIGRLWRAPARTALLRAGNADYLRRHGPIGARDPATLALLRRHDVPAYHSGCLTLTLQRPAAAVRDDQVVACDLDGPPAEALRRRVRSPIKWVGHDEPALRDPEARLARAAALLDLYGRAKAVVTTRLHCALPCLALGTPVLFLPRDGGDRLEPGRRLAHHCSGRDFAAGRCAFDPDDPPPNPADYLALRDGLIEKCRSFVGKFGP